MFSLTQAQKIAKIKTQQSELEAWERKREEKSSKIEARRRLEQKRENTKFAPGYGPAGRVPAYVEAHVLSLKDSPLAKPVFSPGRRCIQPPPPPPPSSHVRRRPQSAAASPDHSSCAFVAGRSCSDVVAVAGSRPEKGRICTRPTTADSRCFPNKQQQQQQKRRGSTTSSPAANCGHHHQRAAGGGRMRPATAPCATTTAAATATATAPRGRRDCSSARKNRKGQREGEEGREQEHEEARLIEQLARLSGVQRAGELFPNVAAFRTAMAVEALQVQLRECRSKSRNINRATTESTGRVQQNRPASAPASSSAHRSKHAADGTPAAPRVGGMNNGARRQRRGMEKRKPEPWDNRSPFVVAENVRAGTTKTATAAIVSSSSVPALRVLIRDDPAFGFLIAPSSTPPPSPSCAHPETTAADLSKLREDRRHHGPTIACKERGEPEGVGNVSRSPFAGSAGHVAADPATTTTVAAAPAAEETRMKACFQRLTVGALIELNHLPNPPEPVRVVLAGLGCLLGWPKRRRNRPTKKDRHRHDLQLLNPPPRSLFSNAYVLRDVLSSVCPQKISSRRLSALTQMLGVAEVAPAKVRSANAAAAVLLEWLLAVVDCARCR